MVIRLQDIVALVTGYLPSLLAAVTDGRHRNLAGAAQPGVASLRAVVLTTGQQIATWFVATPTLAVVGLDASPGRGILAAEACLSRAHKCARGTRARMAHQ
jgi:hypothetical protein